MIYKNPRYADPFGGATLDTDCKILTQEDLLG